jgi:hypothetical protein
VQRAQAAGQHGVVAVEIGQQPGQHAVIGGGGGAGDDAGDLG